MRIVVTVLLVIAAFLAGIAWQRQMAPPPQSSEQQMPAEPQGMPGGASGGQVAEPPSDDPGVAWTVPASWTTEAPRTMRLATYDIPKAGGDAEGGECAVFYFGPKQGGGIEENLSRWVSQFENPTGAERNERKVHGMTLHLVQVRGAYLAPSGPMMQSSGTKAGYMLLGAIVEGPKGAVFFKFTGPEKTVKAAESDFHAMLESLQPK